MERGAARSLLFGALGIAVGSAAVGGCKDMNRLDTAGSVAPGQLPASPPPVPGGNAPAAPGANPTAEARADRADAPDVRALLERLHEVNQKEIRTGQLAQEHGSARQVKEYGAMLVRDHRAADEKVLAVARAKNISLGEGEGAAAAEGQAALEKLRAQRGAAFDRELARLMVEEHERTIALVKDAQAQLGTRSAEVSTLLADLLPTLEAHRAQAAGLSAQAGAKPSATGGEEADTAQGRRPARR